MPWKVEVILRKDGQTIKSPTFASREEAEKELQEIKGNIYQGGGSTALGLPSRPEETSWRRTSRDKSRGTSGS
jgi:hypothetical protein